MDKKIIDVPSENPKQEPNAQQALRVLDAESTAPQDPQDLLVLAVKQNASVDTLERLMVVRKELRAEAAATAFHEAMSAFQAECPIIVKSQPGHEQRYYYAPLEVIVKVVTPFLVKHGFSHKEDAVVTENWVEAIVTVTHRHGHSTTTRFKVPTETKAGMSPQQKYGAAMTYATRYAFCAAFGIRTGELDTDCPPETEPVTKLKAVLWGLLKDRFYNDPAKAQQFLWDEMVMEPTKRMGDLDGPGLKAVIEKTRSRLKQL